MKVRVVMLTHTGSVRHTWEGSLEEEDANYIVVRAIAEKELVFPNVAIHVGDLLVVYFPRNEWFYVQKYLTKDGHVKGWYCNIGSPITFENSTITTQDLILDLFVRPDGNYRVLDLDEFEAEKDKLPAQAVEKVLEAKKKLVRMIEQREVPFNEIKHA